MQRLSEETLRQTLLRVCDGKRGWRSQPMASDGLVLVGGVSREWRHLANLLLQDVCAAYFPSMKGVVVSDMSWRGLYCRARAASEAPTLSWTKVAVPPCSDFWLCVELSTSDDFAEINSDPSPVIMFAETLELTNEVCLDYEVPKEKRVRRMANWLPDLELRVFAVRKSDGYMTELCRRWGTSRLSERGAKKAFVPNTPIPGLGLLALDPRTIEKIRKGGIRWCAEWQRVPQACWCHRPFIRATVYVDDCQPEDGSPTMAVRRVKIAHSSNDGRPLLQCLADGGRHESKFDYRLFPEESDAD